MGNLLDHQMSGDQSVEVFSHLTNNLGIQRVGRDLSDPAAMKTR